MANKISNNKCLLGIILPIALLVAGFITFFVTIYDDNDDYDQWVSSLFATLMFLILIVWWFKTKKNKDGFKWFHIIGPSILLASGFILLGINMSMEKPFVYKYYDCVNWANFVITSAIIVYKIGWSACKDKGTGDKLLVDLVEVDNV